MSEPLSHQEFRSFVSRFDETITAFKGHVDERFDVVEQRLDAIDRMLWQGQRIEEIERRMRTLAERTGHPDLAVPMARPLA